MTNTRTARIDVHLTPDDLAHALRADVTRGLTSTPKSLPPKYFYDERGSRLFDEITRLEEYYPTRREREILTARAAAIATATDADTLIELGSGTSEKTRLLLDALDAHGTLRRFVPFDVSEEVLREAAVSINSTYPDVEVHAVVGDFERHLHALPHDGRCMIAFLGGTIGNFPPAERAAFLAGLAAIIDADDTLLIGFDLVKDVARLEAAYDDAHGVTADFNRNVLHVINRELSADFDPSGFDHLAFFDRANEWIEMRLVARGEQSVRVAGLGLDVSFAAGEQMRTEISAKFTTGRIDAELAAAGLQAHRLWTDVRGDFALALAGPRG